MKLFFLSSAALALVAIVGGVPSTALAEGVSTLMVEPPAPGLTMTSGCGTDVMFFYDLPRNDDGTIVFARSFDWSEGVLVDESKQMETSGSNVCLPMGTGNIHRLRLGNSVEIDRPSLEAVTALVRWLENEGLAEAERVMKAYGIDYASN